MCALVTDCRQGTIYEPYESFLASNVDSFCLFDTPRCWSLPLGRKSPKLALPWQGVSFSVTQWPGVVWVCCWSLFWASGIKHLIVWFCCTLHKLHAKIPDQCARDMGGNTYIQPQDLICSQVVNRPKSNCRPSTCLPKIPLIYCCQVILRWPNGR